MTTEQRYRCIACNQEAPDPEQHTCRRQRIEVCGFCQRQITAPHDCPERRRVEAELAELGRVPTVATTLHEGRPARDRGKPGPADKEARDE